MDSASLPDLVAFFTSATPATIFGLLWWLERSERREKDRENREERKETTAAMNAASQAITSLRDLINAGRPTA